MTNIVSSWKIQALKIAENNLQRHSENIANVDTPGYKSVVGKSFQSIFENGQNVVLSNTNILHMNINDVPNELSGENFGSEQNSKDGNTVDMDKERAAFAQSQIKYEATLQWVKSDFNQIRSAIQP